MITSLCSSLTLGLDAIKTTEMLVYFQLLFIFLGQAFNIFVTSLIFAEAFIVFLDTSDIFPSFFFSCWITKSGMVLL
jgi:hypothetical protein